MGLFASALRSFGTNARLQICRSRENIPGQADKPDTVKIKNLAGPDIRDDEALTVVGDRPSAEHPDRCSKRAEVSAVK
ncbi:hypothetical protein A8B75_19700 [Sphingomonadales bacterium EhC05]|nr:hypothetical protein A8B75_19700 [Sphingomonadales bacterium EhC05]